jgi:acyl carrier protein
MTDGDIRSGLRTYLLQEILHDPDYPLEDGEALISSGLIDSFSLVDIALWVEKTHGLRIEDNELTADNFDTLAQFADHIEKNLPG